MTHLFWIGDFFLLLCTYSTECNCLIPIQARQDVYVTIFTCACGYIDGDEVFLLWVRHAKTFVSCECKECGPPRNGL